MKNKKLIVIGLIAVLIVGLISVFVVARYESSWHKSWKKDGFHSYKDFGDKSGWVEKLGLPANATKEQIMDAKREKWGSSKYKWTTGFHSKGSLCGQA